MSFKDQIIEDLAIVFDEDEFAESILYCPYEDIPKTIPAILSIDQEGTEIQAIAPPAETMRILVKVSDVPSPDYHDEFHLNPGTVTEETWYLAQNLGGGARPGTWLLEISKSDKRRIGR
jgi:hypothetical protein